jgi:hypothetical protein
LSIRANQESRYKFLAMYSSYFIIQTGMDAKIESIDCEQLLFRQGSVSWISVFSRSMGTFQKDASLSYVDILNFNIPKSSNYVSSPFTELSSLTRSSSSIFRKYPSRVQLILYLSSIPKSLILSFILFIKSYDDI